MVKEKNLGKKKEEKKEKKEEISKSEDEETAKHNRQTKIVITIMIISIVFVFLINWIVQENRKFSYEGMNFYKEKEGSILYYKSLLGYVTAYGEEVPFVLKLRNDPRELEKILVEDEIKLKKDIILSLSPEIANCSDTYITMLDFSITLKAFSIKATAATTDKKFAKEHNATLADCRNSINKTVIVMKESNMSRISKEIFFKDCYVVEIKNCEIQESFERFILSYIKDSMLG